MFIRTLLPLAAASMAVSNAFAAPCTEGPYDGRKLLKSCTISVAENEVNGEEIKDIHVCLSRLQKDGGRLGGDKITWFLSTFEMTHESGETEAFVFDTPDGRHNFRSPIDYAVTEFSSDFFYMESHRTKYPENSRKGYIDWHMVDFDVASGALSFEYRKRSGIMLGRWSDKIKFQAVCQ